MDGFNHDPTHNAAFSISHKPDAQYEKAHTPRTIFKRLRDR
jgi:hypothetical protein